MRGRFDSDEGDVPDEAGQSRVHLQSLKEKLRLRKGFPEMVRKYSQTLHEMSTKKWYGNTMVRLPEALGGP